MANAWIEETLPQIISTLTTQHPFKSQFSALTTNADRVQFCLAQKEVQRWVGLFVSKFPPNQTGLKCSTTAGKYRETGNDHFRGHNFKSAIQLYSRAICFAPQIGVDKTASELALAFGNRSAAYFQIGQHENALKDIDDALAFGYGQFKSTTKLQLRKCDCLIRLERASEAEKLLHFMQKPTDDEKDTKRWIELFGQISLGEDKKNESKPKACDISLIEKLANKGLFKSNEKIPSFSAKVAVQYDEVKGRHLVAQEDIEFGDILAISQPHVTLLDSKDVLKYCHHCCRDLESAQIRSIACIGCSSVVFCSDECRTESANSYHRYECGQTDLLVRLHKFAQMSLRLLYRAGIDQIRSVVDSAPEEASHLSAQAEGHYSHVYQLVHHSDGPLKDLVISFTKMLKWSILAGLLRQLVKNSNFPIGPKEDEKLIGGILLRHLLLSCFNTFDYSPLYNDKESRKFGEVESSPVLLDLYPLYASTLNHSCQANARLESPNNQSVCLLQAAQPISAGTEITIPYLKDDFNKSSSPRLFKDRYLVTCFCARCGYCARNTPFGLTDYLNLSCSDCGHSMEHSSVHRSESEVFRCTNCRLTMTNAEMKRRYLKYDQLESSFLQLYHAGENRVCKLLVIVEPIEALLHRDASILTLFHSVLGGYFTSSGQINKGWTYLEKFLAVYERTFGEESVVLLEAFNFVHKQIFGLMKMVNPIKVFEQQDSELYQRYLARVEQWKQLKLKYYKEC